MIKGHKISYQSQKVSILKGVDINVGYGEFLAIVGPNGAGKSSLLNVLANEIKTDQKQDIYFKEKIISRWNLEELSKHKAKFSQHNAQDIPLLVKDVVLMGRYPYFSSQPATEDFVVVEKAMQKTDIVHFQERDYNSLSGGEKQRVHLARVLAQLDNDIAHRLLFLDEPLNNLDIKHQHKTLELIKKFTKNNNTAIVVLHDLNLAASFADKILLMEKGEVLAYGLPEEVFTEDKISRAYGFPCSICKHPINESTMILFG
ncbi:heme ABC transporter ATP-binding protein [Epilithonimonas mollis]|uniref:Iron complex transport system ATP-binding protein n=1 Tax=Epilithonimonas mollis TaxID=216903 RepID=A0A1M6TX00_9FLAO|nr:heme ABC transporter ATP-binding protein [Epilithonimonas mollis]SHK61469.1 iron complex transport system ATP-binding protein [Epilithonimonas mollis]